MRMVIHSGTDANDVKISWEGERSVYVKIKRPEWLQDSTMMSGVDISQDALGQDIETYPETHQVYNSMGFDFKEA